MKDFLDELDNELAWASSLSKPQAAESKKPAPKKPAPKPSWARPPKKHNSDSKSPTGAKPHTGWKSKGPHKSKNNNNNRRHNNRGNHGGYMSKSNISFPDTKFYLPTLRDKYTRYMPIGWNDETGAKNMGMAQYGDDILLIDCGVQFAEPDMLGADYSIPDISFLTKYTKNIKWFVITHAHLDHIGALKHILPNLDYPPLYATRLTLGIIRKSLDEFRILDKCTLIEVDATSDMKHKIGHFDVEFFGVTHSVPDCAGLYIESPGGAKFVHTWDFKIDFTPRLDPPANLERIAGIGKRGVTLLLSDSTGSTRPGFSTSEKWVGETLEKIVANHKKWRLIIATFSSWISRVQQLADIAAQHDKHIFLSGRSMVENIAIAKELWYLNIKKGIMKKMTPKSTKWIPPHKQIIITTWSQWEEYSALTRMSEWKHNSIEIVGGDTVVFSSSVVPGNERSVVSVINKLIKLGANVITKNDAEVHTGWHAFQEEQKIMLNLVKPKYFMPVYGDLYFRDAHRKTAISTGFNDDNILLIDNGNIVDFAPDGTVFKSKIKAPIQDFVIDGYGIGLAKSHVVQARDKMMNSWVLVVLFKVDKKSKAILGHIKLETRGLVYLEEVRYIHRIIIKKSKEVYEATVKDIPDIDQKDLVKVLRTDLERFIQKRTDREPMVIPMIMEV